MTQQCNGCRFWQLDADTIDQNDPTGASDIVAAARRR
jgi:hypothetical protein